MRNPCRTLQTFHLLSGRSTFIWQQDAVREAEKATGAVRESYLIIAEQFRRLAKVADAETKRLSINKSVNVYVCVVR